MEESELKDTYQALVEALKLGITAPSQEKALECARLAEILAQRCTEEEVEKAQNEAMLTLRRN